jgi:hypothetical protein
MSDHLSGQGINPSRSFRWQKRSRARSNQFAVMPGTFKERISSGVTGREHAYPTSSSIEARSQRDPVGGFLVLRREVRFAGTAGAIVGGGVTLVAGTALAGAVEVGGVTPAVAVGGGITATAGGGGVTMAACGAREAGAVAGGAVTLSGGTTWLPGTVGGASLTLGARTALAGVVSGGGITMAPVTARLPGAVVSAGVTLAASTGPPGDGSVGGVDGSGAFWRRFGISAGFSAGGVTWALATGFSLGSVS